MPTYTTGRDALQVLAAHLRAKLVTDYPADFVSYGGALVLAEGDTDEPRPMDGLTGRPTIELAIDSDEHSSLIEMIDREARDCAVSVAVVADDFTGARIGVANPKG
ncbi:MAG TPA: hypothetical protein VNM48_09025, partial [Chloroflexota bacterium]|nr:hypothetical protein [Chloroflexota bacterium]